MCQPVLLHEMLNPIYLPAPTPQDLRITDLSDKLQRTGQNPSGATGSPRHHLPPQNFPQQHPGGPGGGGGNMSGGGGTSQQKQQFHPQRPPLPGIGNNYGAT